MVSDAPADHARKDQIVALRSVAPRATTNATPRPNTDRARRDRNVVLRFVAPLYLVTRQTATHGPKCSIKVRDHFAPERAKYLVTERAARARTET